MNPRYIKPQFRRVIRLRHVVNVRFWLGKRLPPSRGASWARWFRDRDENPEWSAEDFAEAKPFAEALPELAAKMRGEGEA